MAKGTTNIPSSATDSRNKTGVKMYLVAAPEQGCGEDTYSNAGCYIGEDNCLYSGGKLVATAEELDGLVRACVEEQVGALPETDVSGPIAAHNTDAEAHADIRVLASAALDAVENAQGAAEGAQRAAEGAQGAAEGAQRAAEGAQGAAEGVLSAMKALALSATDDGAGNVTITMTKEE